MSPVFPFRLCFLLFDGYSNMVLASAIEPLRAANNLSGKAQFSWRLVTMDAAPAVSSSGLSLLPDGTLAKIDDFDALVVVAGYRVREYANRRVLGAIRRATRGVTLLAGHDTGAWILAEAGLLDGYQATLHWMEQTSFQEEFPQVEMMPRLYVQDGNRVTTGTAEGTMAFSLDLISQRGGEALSLDVRNMFDDVMRGDMVEPAETRPGTFAGPLGRAVLLMHQNMENPLSIPQVARQSAMSQRTLERMFQHLLGTSAGDYYRNLRLARAQFLASTGALRLAEIAIRTGFSSAATLARAFQRQYGMSLGEARKLTNRPKAPSQGGRTGRDVMAPPIFRPEV
ncbi:GlxA family transcriptional regulator [Neogemmobacter tilapiae]|nr:GlxA family transcriptional regulator [Gemmobacter tilapiae]